MEQSDWKPTMEDILNVVSREFRANTHNPVESQENELVIPVDTWADIFRAADRQYP